MFKIILIDFIHEQKQKLQENKIQQFIKWIYKLQVEIIYKYKDIILKKLLCKQIELIMRNKKACCKLCRVNRQVISDRCQHLNSMMERDVLVV